MKKEGVMVDTDGFDYFKACEEDAEVKVLTRLGSLPYEEREEEFRKMWVEKGGEVEGGEDEDWALVAEGFSKSSS